MEKINGKKIHVQLQPEKSLSPEINTSLVTDNASVIHEEINWLKAVLTCRIDELNHIRKNDELAIREETKASVFSDFESQDLSGKKGAYAEFVNEFKLSDEERLLLITSLVPHISPETLTEKLRSNSTAIKINYPDLGGYFDSTFTNFVPTLQTALYLLAGSDLSAVLYHHLFLMEKSKLIHEQVITLRPVSTSEDDTNRRNYAVCLAPEYVEYLVSGKKPRPDFGRAFPATLITTSLNWEHLVVKSNVMKELKRIMRWEEHGRELLDITGHKLNSSFTCLFYGPSGSGKTLAVQLLGKSLGIDVFRIDLSMVVSKYIGETEKNLAYLFDRAKGKRWILFFDEADSLFGKRTEINDAKDKWANLEMSYLLQRMEEHNGLTVLATNLKNNIDGAMTRRFQSVIYFNRPDATQRIDLWKKLLPAPFVYHKDLNFDKLAGFELTGGNITNIVKADCLDALARGTKIVDSQDLADAINREFNKENRFPN